MATGAGDAAPRGEVACAGEALLVGEGPVAGELAPAGAGEAAVAGEAAAEGAVLTGSDGVASGAGLTVPTVGVGEVLAAGGEPGPP